MLGGLISLAAGPPSAIEKWASLKYETAGANLYAELPWASGSPSEGNCASLGIVAHVEIFFSCPNWGEGVLLESSGRS